MITRRHIAVADEPRYGRASKPATAVRARNINPTGHTRLPRYARGKTGTIERDHGVYVFPDTNARNFAGEKPQHVYSVRFAARELWGEAGHRRATPSISICGTDYLEPA